MSLELRLEVADGLWLHKAEFERRKAQVRRWKNEDEIERRRGLYGAADQSSSEDEARDGNIGDADLTSVFIKSTKPGAVFGGNKKMRHKYKNLSVKI